MSVLNEEFTALWDDAVRTVDPALLPSALARVCARVLPFDAAGLSLHGDPDSRVPLGASEEAAATAERLQFTHGDGPCFLAMREGRPVVVTETAWRERWPVLAQDHFSLTPFRGGLSVPLRVGPVRFGVLDLYDRVSQEVDGGTVVDGQLVAARVSAVLLEHLRENDSGRSVTAPGGEEAVWFDSPGALARRQVWVAVGMVALGLGVTSEEALAILRASCFSLGRTLEDLAGDVVHRHLDVQQFG